MKKTLKILIAIFGGLVICFGVMFLVDYSRVSNGKQSIFSISKHEETQDTETKEMPLEDLPEYYTMDKAIEDGCFVISNDNKIYNKDVLETFIEKTNINAQNRQEATLRILLFTDEGDAIIKDVIYNDKGYVVKIDNTRDQWSVDEDRTIKTLEDFPKGVYGITEVENENMIEVHLAVYAMIDYVSSEAKQFEDYLICLYPKTAEECYIYSFQGKVIESHEEYIIVEPNQGEKIKNSADKISIGLGENNDAVYRIGTSVKVIYSGYIMESYPAQVRASKIEIQPIEEFEIKFYAEIPQTDKKIVTIIDKSESINYSYNIYVYNGSVNIIINDKEISLKEALLENKITMDEIIAKVNQDLNDGKINGGGYNDGGSMMYQYKNYTIIKCHTVSGNRDVYIGTKEMTLDDVI